VHADLGDWVAVGAANWSWRGSLVSATGAGSIAWDGNGGGSESAERKALSRVLGTAASAANRTRRGALVWVFGTAMDGADRSY